MSKKIFSLTLTLLMVLTMAGSFGAYAATTYDVSSAQETVVSIRGGFEECTWTEMYSNLVVVRGEGYATYKINVSEAGKYDFTLVAGTTEAFSEGINVYVGDSLVLENKGIATTSSYATENANKLGTVELSEGEHTIKLENVSDSAAYFFRLNIDVPGIKLAEAVTTLGIGSRTSTTATEIYANRENSTGGDYISTEGMIVLRPENDTANKSEITYDIYAPESGLYSLYVMCGASSGSITTFDTYVDGSLTTGGMPTKSHQGYSKALKSCISVLNLAKGGHTITLKLTANDSYFFGVEFAKATTGLSVSTAQKTSINAISDLAYGNPNKIYTSDGILEYVAGNKVSYIINAEEAGIYQFKMEAGSVGDIALKVYTQDGSVFEGSFKTTGAYNTYAERDVCKVTLKEGVQVITIENVDNGSWTRGFAFDVCGTKLSSSASVRIPAVNFSSKDTAQNEVLSNQSSQAGIISTDGAVVMRDGYTYSYDVYAPEAGNYVLSFVSGGGSVIGAVKDENGNSLLTGTLANETKEAQGEGDALISALLNAAETKSGVLSLKKGTTTLVITAETASTYVYSLSLAPAKPSVVLYEGEIMDEIVAYDVVDGTMTLKAELNGYLAGKTAMVTFAIYETDDETGVKKLYKAYTETVAATAETVVTGSVNNITKADGKTYTAKIFLWDAETYTGETVNYVE